MSEHVLRTLADVQKEIHSLESSLTEKKRFANLLCKMANQPDIYNDVDVEQNKPIGSRPTRGDEFVTHKAMTAFRKAFEMAGEPLDVNTLYQMLLDGGYEFEAKSETNAKNSIRVTLSKNSTVFLKLSNGKYGLLNWYPNAKTRKKKGSDSTQETESSESEVQDEEIEGQNVMEQEFRLKSDAPEKKVIA